MLPLRGSRREATEGVEGLSVGRSRFATPSGPLGHLPLIALRAGGGLSALALLAACSQKPASHEAALSPLDCAQPFAAQARRIAAQPGLDAAPRDPAEPYRWYSSGDGATSYLITEPGAPGHPAIMMQTALRGDVRTTGCAYGDQAGYDQLMAYLDSLKTWRRK